MVYTDRVRVTGLDPVYLFTAVRRATHVAGIPECQFISQGCVQWPMSWAMCPGLAWLAA